MTRRMLSLLAVTCLLTTGCSRGGDNPLGVDLPFLSGADKCDSETLLPALVDGNTTMDTKGIGLDTPTCVGDWAMAGTTSDDRNRQMVNVLFHRADGTWQYVTLGGWFDCVTNSGVPYEVAEQLPGCSQHKGPYG